MPITPADAEVIRNAISMVTDQIYSEIDKKDKKALAVHATNVQSIDIALRAVINFFNHVGQIKASLELMQDNQRAIALSLANIAEHLTP
jgi:hypothetical protein